MAGKEVGGVEHLEFQEASSRAVGEEFLEENWALQQKKAKTKNMIPQLHSPGMS